MKKTVILFLVCVGAVHAWAQSTCETRVDAHQEATTNQRVNYCLVPGYGENETGPHMIFSSSDPYWIPQPAPAKAVRPTATNGYFDGADVEVTHSFVQTRQFPKFTDEHVSEQYKREYQEAIHSGPVTAQEAIAHTECEPEADDIGYETDGAGETKAGVNARQSKPGRRLLKVAPVEKSSVTTDLENVEEIASLAGQYTYDDDAYAPAGATTAAQSSNLGDYKPAGIADMPQEDSQDIAAEAYSYAPKTTSQSTTRTKKTTSTVTTKTSSKSSDEIAAGEYSYAPASYGSSTSETTVTETPAPAAAAQKVSKDIAVGEYSYAPASYGSSTSETTVTETPAPAAAASQKVSEDIAVGEYEYAPVSYGSSVSETTVTETPAPAAVSQKESEDIAVGEYEYAPVSYGSSSSSSSETTATETPAPAAVSQKESEDIAVGEYEYAPVSYGSSSSSETTVTETPAPAAVSQKESEDIPVGEYSYAPAQ